MDFYEILGVARSATLEEIKSAYRSLAFKYHPDKDQGNVSKFKEISSAFETLSDINRKCRYDAFNKHSTSPPIKEEKPLQNKTYGNCSFFENKNTGRNIMAHYKTTPELLKNGGKKSIVIQKRSSCNKCVGDGTHLIVCNTCKGSGRMFIGGISHDHQPICNTCRGSGGKDILCDACSGQGVNKWEQKEVFFTVPSNSIIGNQITILGEGEASPKKLPEFLRIVLV